MAPNDGKRTEKYACDCCRLSKVACSREHSGCQRCRKTGAKCAYSRSGVIRRRSKRKSETAHSSPLHLETAINCTSITPETRIRSGGVQCHLAADIEATRERLRDLNTPEQHGSLDALSYLSEACVSTGARHEISKRDPAAKDFFLFEEHAIEWAEVFENVLQKSGPLMSMAPPDVMDHLRAARPHKVRDRSWLVMYYSIILNTVASISLKGKLQRNLWLALSDVGVLLEPSEANINALVLVLSQASEFTGPSLCWMLATSACRMLQALGVNQRRLDPQIRERRLMRFWHLNLLDKGLAIIFGRTPTFHHEMVREIGLPSLEQIQPSRPHLTSTGASMVFGAHYMYQKILLSHLMDQIWHCLYGEAKPNEHSIEAASKDLISWYEQARKILEAAALSEKPFCDAQNARSIDVALHTIEFHFLHLTVLLTRSSAHMQAQCLDASKRMLHLLQDMAPESKEPYHPIIWQLVCCPFTPLLILFCDILSNGKRNLEESKEALAAMEHVPRYLKKLSLRNSLATSLEGIAKVFVQHSRTVLCRLDPARPNADELAAQSPALPLGSLPYGRLPDEDILHLNSLFSNTASIIPTTAQIEMGNFDVEPNNDLAMFTDSLDNDGMLDWLNWDSQAQKSE